MPRALVLSMIAMCALAGCGQWDAIASGLAASERYDRATAAELQLDVVISCAPEGEPHFAPCSGELELVLSNTQTNERARARVPEVGPIHGALPVGDYQIALVIDGMQIGLSSASGIGSVPLHEGSQALGTLFVRFVELRPGSFREQAIHAERARGAYHLPHVDFVHSPERGLLLIDARLESPPT